MRRTTFFATSPVSFIVSSNSAAIKARPAAIRNRKLNSCRSSRWITFCQPGLFHCASQVAPFVHHEPYVVVHPGSRSGARQWQPAYFAALADYCADHGYHVVLTGTPDELYITGYLAGLMKHTPVNLAGKTSLGVVAALIKHAHLLIANCTGVSHIAAATETPGLIISMDGEPHRWGPMNRSLHHVFDWTQNRSFTEVYNCLVNLLATDMKKANAVAKYAIFQSGRMGFIVE